MYLQLQIIKGPKSGESFTYPPCSTIRIGRIVRGNNLAIKDSGISSKHLLIQHNSQNNKWVLQDLDSSNGTTLNSSPKINPFEKFDLREGDVIKLGESTSICVNIVSENVGDCSVQVRRNTRSRAVKKAEIEDKGEMEKIDGEIVENVRKGRASASEDCSVGRRNTRSQVAKDEGKVGEVGVSAKRRGKPPRKGKVLEKIPEIETIPESLSELEEEGVNLQSHQSVFRNVESENEIPEKTKLVEVKKEVEEYEEAGSHGAVETSGGSAACVCENSEEKKAEELDLETMTLGELFDYFEVALPREIKEASEKYIEEIRKKAAQVEEYMMQAKKSSLE